MENNNNHAPRPMMTWDRLLGFLPLLKRLGLSTIVVVAFSLITRTISIYRDRLLALYLGTSLVVDDFFLLMGICSLSCTVFTSSSINFYIPTIRENESSTFFSRINWRLVSTWFGVAVLLFLFLLLILDLPTTGLLLTAASFLFLSLNHLQATFLNIQKKFSFPTFSFLIPVLFTIFPVVAEYNSTESLLLFFLAGNIVQFVALLAFHPFLQKVWAGFREQQTEGTDRLLPYPRFLKLWLPLLIATVHFPLPEIVIIMLAKTLEVGAVAQIGFAMRVPYAIINILTYSFWTVLLPKIQIDLNLLGSKKSFYGFILFFLSMGVLSMALLLANDLIIKLVFEGGTSISPEEITQMRKIQSFFICTLPFQMFTNIALRFLHSLRKTAVSLVITVCGMGCMLVYFFVYKKSLMGITEGFLLNAVVTFVICFFYLLWSFRKSSTKQP